MDTTWSTCCCTPPQTRGDTIVVGSDYDFRNEPILRFYSRHLPEGKTLAYVFHDD